MKRSARDLVDDAWTEIDHGDLEAANELIERALAADPNAYERGEAMLLRAHVLVLDGAIEEATAAFEAVGSNLPEDDAELFIDLANVALALGQAERAAEAADRAIALDETLADAAYARALAAEALGDDAAMRSLFIKTAALDAAEPDPPWAMSTDDFADIAEAALHELPAEVTDRLENVPIIVEAAPSEALLADGIDPRLLGLFSGVPLTERSSIEPGEPSLDAIYLYQRNLERNCTSRGELEEEIRITVLHETAHFFGLEDEDLDEIGLG